jgi:4-hydroxyphenylpyruvate dioxygenase
MNDAVSAPPIDRESIGEPSNPLGLAGLEFVEYSTSRPQALGQVLEMLGFRPVARHRSREVLLYRQGAMNVVINAHAGPEGAPPGETPEISAIGLRVRDAAAAYRRALDAGAWGVPVQVAVMELHIPAIHGVGASRIYLVDRCNDFTIWDVDFVPIPTVDRQPPALAGLHWFGLVQYIGAGRTADWVVFYAELFGFQPLPAGHRFGILPRGRILRSPCGSLHLQLIEPDPGDGSAGADRPQGGEDERLQRLAFGAPDVPAAVAAWRHRGVDFAERGDQALGALTLPLAGGVMVELVHDARDEVTPPGPLSLVPPRDGSAPSVGRAALP